MSEENAIVEDSSVDPGQAENTPQEEGHEDLNPTEEGGAFSEEQKQYMKSWMGRMQKDIVDSVTQSVAAQLPKHQPVQQSYSEPPDNDLRALDAFNEGLQNKIFEGNVVGAIREAMGVLNAAERNAMESKSAQLKESLATWSDKPFYKDIYPEMKVVADNMVKQGVPPADAAEYGYTKALADHALKNMKADTGGLSLEGGSSVSAPRKKDTKLPEQFMAAAKRDIAAGVFKDMEEYKASLSPNIKKTYGIQ